MVSIMDLWNEGACEPGQRPQAYYSARDTRSARSDHCSGFACTECWGSGKSERSGALIGSLLIYIIPAVLNIYNIRSLISGS